MIQRINTDADSTAWTFEWACRRRGWLFGALALLYLLAFNGEFRIRNDAAEYITVAQHLYDAEAFVSSHLSQHRHLGMVYLLTMTFELTGSVDLTPPLVWMLLMGLGTLAANYRLMLLHLGRPQAVWLTCLLGLSTTFYVHAYELMTDMPFLFGVMIFLCGYEGLNHWFRNGRQPGRLWIRAMDVGMLLVGLLILASMRRTMWVFLAAALATLLWRGRKRLTLGSWIWVGTAILLTGAALWWVIFDSRGGTAYQTEFMWHKFAARGFVDVLTMFGRNVFVIFESSAVEGALGASTAPGLNSALGLLILASGVWVIRHHRLWGLYVLLTVMSFAVHKPTARYFLAILPFLVYGWHSMAMRLSRWAPRSWGAIVFAAMMLIWLTPNVLGVVDTIIEQRRTLFLEHYRKGAYARMQRMADVIHDQLEPDDVVIAKAAPVVTYFSNRVAVNHRVLNQWRRNDPIRLQRLQAQTNLYMLEPLDEFTQRYVFTDPAWLRLTPGEVVARSPRKKGHDYVLRRVMQTNQPTTPSVD